jgi:hypothetical protein
VTDADFKISLDPQSANVERGRKLAVTVTLDRLGGFTGNVTVTVQGADDLGIKLNRDSAVIAGLSAKFKLKIKGRAPTGRHQLEFIAADSTGRQRKATLVLDVP